MMPKILLRTVSSLTLLTLSCALPPPGKVQRQPYVRVGLVQHRDSVAVMVSDKFSLRGSSGKLVGGNLHGGRWLVTFLHGEAARVEYRLLAATTRDRAEAFELLHRVSKAGVLPELLEQKPMATRLPMDDQETIAYQIYVRERFRTAERATQRQQQLASRLSTQMVEHVTKPAKGILRLRSLDPPPNGLRTAGRFDMESGFQIQADRIALSDVTEGSGFHWEGKESRIYRGAFEFLVDRAGKLTVVNVLPVEAYVAGVVPSEMHPDFPLEALKAQAVAARSEVFSRLGIRHIVDGFDLCAEGHCQVYSGITRENENSNRAVAATAGLVLKREGRVVDAVYHGVCGGHTENNDSVWQGAAQAHLRGIFDGDGRRHVLGNTLTQEDRAARWIVSQPPVYCNIATANLPKAMAYARKYFRWEVSTSREALQQHIAKSTGENFGELIDLVLLQRGRSGRLMRLKVVGTEKSFEISSELAIRRALSPSTLWSSCFVVTKEMRGDKPEKFIFRGAGWGHGVGMCQIGAGIMALRGWTLETILQHYYTGVNIEMAY